jgi:tetratricopeptide (TPR) repeat protein
MRCSLFEQYDSLIIQGNRTGSFSDIKFLTYFILIFVFLLCACSKLTKIREIRNSGATDLDVSCCALDSVPAEIGRLANLVSLDLSVNNISVLPQDIWRLKNLKSLNLGWNKIRCVPPEISKLTALEELILSGNAIDSLPKEMSALKNLKKLELSWTNISAIPPEFSNLSNLRDLKIYDVPLRDEESIKAQFPHTTVCFDFVLPKDAGRYYYRKGGRFQASNHFASAIKYYTLALDADPKLMYAYRNRGVSRYNTQDANGAYEDWKRAAQLGDTLSRSYLAKFRR